MFQFSLQILSEISLIRRRIQQDSIINVHTYRCGVSAILYPCQILMKFGFPRQIFDKYSNIKFHENPSIGSRVVPCGQTDTQTDGHIDRRTHRQTDRRTYIRKLIAAYCNFGNELNTAQSKQASTCKLMLNLVCNVLAQLLAVSVHVYSFHKSVMSLPYFLGIFLIFFDVSSDASTSH